MFPYMEQAPLYASFNNASINGGGVIGSDQY
jgi:hypothetical protein